MLCYADDIALIVTTPTLPINANIIAWVHNYQYLAPALIMTTPAPAEPLEKAQNEALGALRWTKTCNIRAEAHVPPIGKRIQALHSAMLFINFNKGRDLHLLRDIQQSFH
ncbi:hypothetical protein E2C01_053416 [Portunus trituberculatus]|uniref:Uncharacterized protein n=1 Tax=Portunus trituberculatus TaxID=210409 RepID=A0A5B7GQ89_PORTR|nr:hypothetical protein [Portunus trituberculatus]